MSMQGKLFAPGSSGLSSCDHIRSCDRHHSHSLSCHIPRKCNICLQEQRMLVRLCGRPDCLQS